MATKAFVLLSGGVDSTTNVAIAHTELAKGTYGDLQAVSVDYGQRHIREIASAKKVCDYFGIQHHILQLGPQPSSMLTDANAKVPDISYGDIKGVSPTYVPFRNGQLLSLITAFAHSEVEKANAGYPDPEHLCDAVIYFGAHAEDAAGWAYPDCTPEFIGAMANAIYIGTYHKVRLLTPLAFMDKTDVVRLGTRHHAPYEHTWSCYKGEEYHCGTCPTCRARHEAFVKAHVGDPTIYAAMPPGSSKDYAKVLGINYHLPVVSDVRPS